MIYSSVGNTVGKSDSTDLVANPKKGSLLAIETTFVKEIYFSGLLGSCNVFFFTLQASELEMSLF